MPFCSNCGNKIDDEVKFCSNCGTKVVDSNTDSVECNNLNKTGTVVIHRGGGMQDILRAYKIFIDGREMGAIKANEEKTFELKYGEHVIQFKIDWKGSKLLEFQLNDDKPIVRVECSCYSKLGTTYGVAKSFFGSNDEYIKAFIE